ncbi:hypothetical protein MMC25_005915 [Agyrium rufum]|nr:hypothetical protein [Agyrium rufum]
MNLDRQTALFSSHLEILTHLLRHHGQPTILVVCLSTDQFLNILVDNVNDSASSTVDVAPNGNRIESHPLLIPTIRLISQAKCIETVYVTSLAQLKAYLTDLGAGNSIQKFPLVPDQAQVRKPKLTIINLLDLHRSSGEWTAQGISRTTALAIEATSAQDMQLTLAEIERAEEGEQTRPADPNISNPWNDQVPLLNTSLRLGGEEQGWAGRTIEIGKVIGRWCSFNDLRHH